MSESTPLAIVAAIGTNRALGRDGALPWHLPGDLAHFRDLTMGRPMIMGRKTFASIGRALPGRESIVVSRDAGLALPPGVHRVESPGDALEMAGRRAKAIGADEISLIGGAALFESMMDATDRLHMTFVEMSPEADTFFPPIDPGLWRETSRIVPPRHPGDEAPCVFVEYVRR